MLRSTGIADNDSPAAKIKEAMDFNGPAVVNEENLY
jgi:hypothetical protein